MKYLVTGATGFLGTHLIHALAKGGHDLVALCRSDEPELEDLGVAVRRGDVLDGESVRAAAEGCDGLFHCAGMVSRVRRRRRVSTGPRRWKNRCSELFHTGGSPLIAERGSISSLGP